MILSKWKKFLLSSTKSFYKRMSVKTFLNMIRSVKIRGTNEISPQRPLNVTPAKPQDLTGSLLVSSRMIQSDIILGCKWSKCLMKTTFQATLKTQDLFCFLKRTSHPQICQTSDRLLFYHKLPKFWKRQLRTKLMSMVVSYQYLEAIRLVLNEASLHT